MAGAILGSLLYIASLTALAAFDERGHNLVVSLVVASFIWFTGGFALTLLLTIVPWTIAVWAHRKVRTAGRIYFPVVGAALVFIIGCATASISPKPLWVEDQTFLDGARIAAEREGIGFLLAGMALGSSYWWLAEQQLRADSRKTRSIEA